MEFLMTYGWAILIMLVVISVLFYLGVLTPHGLAPNSCTFPAGFSCYGYKVTEGGVLELDLGQATGSNIRVTGFACSAEESPNITAMDVRIGGGRHTNLTGLPLCYNYDGTIPSTGDFYKGKLILVYKDLTQG